MFIRLYTQGRLKGVKRTNLPICFKGNKRIKSIEQSNKCVDVYV